MSGDLAGMHHGGDADGFLGLRSPVLETEEAEGNEESGEE